MEWDLDVDRDNRVLWVRGCVLLKELGASLTNGLREVIGPRWRLLVSFSCLEEKAKLRSAVRPVTRLWRERTCVTLASEIVSGDGPVRLIALTKEAWLVRASDGTVGWTNDPLADVQPRAFQAVNPTDRRWLDIARSFLGTPYCAGGTTKSGMDCSGLAQRLYREVAARIIPRHSTNQLAAAIPRLRFSSAGLPNTVHVGLLLRLPCGGMSIIHASSSKGMVVEGRVEEFDA